MLLRELLPERSSQDIWEERIRLRLGGQEYVLRILPMAANERWKDRVQSDAAQALAALEGVDSVADAVRVLHGVESGTLLALLHEYDIDGVLPDDEWMRDNVSEQAVLRSFLEVLSAAHPMLAVLVDTMIREPQVLSALMSETRQRAPGNGSRPATAGRRARSAKA